MNMKFELASAENSVAFVWGHNNVNTRSVVNPKLFIPEYRWRIRIPEFAVF